MTRRNTQERGFIALVSVVIISAILLALVFTLSVSSFFTRFSALDAEFKRQSVALAEACINVAVLKFSQSDFAGGIVTVDASDPDSTCTIVSIDSSGVLKSAADYKGAYTNLCVTVDSSYEVTASKELPLSTAACP